MKKAWALMASFCALTALSLARAHADDWQHRSLTSSDGITIDLDYFPAYTNDQDIGGLIGWYSSSLWLNISGAGLQPSDQVRVVLMDYVSNSNSEPSVTSQQTIDLQYDSNQNKFTASAHPIIIGNDTNVDPTAQYFQKIAVVVSGRWLLDPISDTTNFQFTMH